jgi:hypothetical protein
MTILLSSPLRGFLNEIVSVMSAIGLVLSPHTSVLLTCTERSDPKAKRSSYDLAYEALA